ncbi:MAG: hypothetical protein COA47_16000 [Robiginitomaculum sp.]|nr:MAG: hypothetical protein COA47_16000 [Robiginitomaculum sp.]
MNLQSGKRADPECLSGDKAGNSRRSPSVQSKAADVLPERSSRAGRFPVRLLAIFLTAASVQCAMDDHLDGVLQRQNCALQSANPSGKNWRD